jgi:L-fuconolactonase
MRIDSAVQLVDRSRFSYPWLADAPGQMQRDFAAASITTILGRNRFDGGVLLALLDDPAETDWLLSLAGEYPAILAVMGNTRDARDLDRWQRHRVFRGVRHRWTPASGEWIAEVGARGLRCDIEAEAGEIARAEPLPHMALAHMAGATYHAEDFENWARAVEQWPGMIKIDGLINGAGSGGWKAERYRPWLAHLMRTHGPGRLLWGSDWPRCLYTGTWKESLAAFTQAMGAQTMEVRSRLLGETAMSHYGIGGEAG